MKVRVLRPQSADTCRRGGFSKAGSGAQRVRPIGLFPGKGFKAVGIRPAVPDHLDFHGFGPAAEMAVGGRWPVHGVEQVKLLEYAVGPQVKIVANKVFYRLLGNMTGAKGGDRNGCRLGHANGIEIGRASCRERGWEEGVDGG